MAGEKEACRKTQVAEQFSRLANAVERSLSLLSDIESRFTTVLRDEPPLEKERAEEVRSIAVPLAEDIRCIALKVIANNEAMESILNRAEI